MARSMDSTTIGGSELSVEERLSAVAETLRVKKLWERERARKERMQRDMGIGYLVYLARFYARESRRRFARKMGTSESAMTRWEHGLQLPTLLTMQMVSITWILINCAF